MSIVRYAAVPGFGGGDDGGGNRNGESRLESWFVAGSRPTVLFQSLINHLWRKNSQMAGSFLLETNPQIASTLPVNSRLYI